MNGKDLLTGLSYIDPKHIAEAENATYSPHKRIKSPLLIAAIVCMTVLLMGSAIITLRLQDMSIDVPAYTDYWGDERTLFSMQGLQGSKNYAAAQEWQQFLHTYDPDKSILYANNDFQAPDAYASYSCYSQEMVDKLNEISRKYGLDLLGVPWLYRKVDHVFEAVGIESIFTDKVITQGHTISGYCFRDGTFEIEGDFRLTGTWDRDVGFSFRSVQKTSFDGVIGSIGDLDDYDQWAYTMDDGTEALLVLRKSNGEKSKEGWVIVDKEACFVVASASGPLVDIFGGIPNDKAFMEAFCEAFNFTYTVRQVDSEIAYQLECEEEPHTYGQWIEYLLTDPEQSKVYPGLTYALLDINDDGQEELLLRCSEHDFTQQQRDENSFCTVTGMRDGRLVHLVDHGVCYLCEDNVLEYLSPFEDTPISHAYERFGQDYKPELVEYIHRREENGKLYRQVDGQLVEISQEAADRIVSEHPHIEIEFMPAADFRE